MKYIDADKLIAEIERRMKCYDRDGCEPNDGKWVELVTMKHFIESLQQEPRFPQYNNIVDKVFGAGNLESFEYDEAEMLVALAKEELLKSLQQEQPKLPGYNKALLEVKSKVDELYEETSIGLSECDSDLYNGIAETCMKLRGFIKARLESDERSEVDLKKVVMIDNIVMNMIGEGYNDGFKTRPFYEEVVRRINARKEE